MGANAVARRDFIVNCNTCKSAIEVPAAIRYWVCDSCDYDICVECCVRLPGTTPVRFCGRACTKWNRRARLFAEKDAQRRWRTESRQRDGVDVLQVEVENVLELLDL